MSLINLIISAHLGGYNIYNGFCYCRVMKMESELYVITKKIAKHGKQAVIIVPKVLEGRSKPGTLTKLTIEVLERIEDEK